MRRIRYQVAASLDGYIAGPKGEADWIITDPDIDFRALFAQFDTLLVGRKTFEAVGGTKHNGKGSVMPGMKVLVFSRTLRQADYPQLTIVRGNVKKAVTALRKEEGKDIWIFGGGQLFQSLLDEGLVDTVELAIIPVLLGRGIPLLAPSAKRAKLRLTGHKVYKTGIVLLEYAVEPAGRKKKAAGAKR